MQAGRGQQQPKGQRCQKGCQGSGTQASPTLWGDSAEVTTTQGCEFLGPRGGGRAAQATALLPPITFLSSPSFQRILSYSTPLSSFTFDIYCRLTMC